MPGACWSFTSAGQRARSEGAISMKLKTESWEPLSWFPAFASLFSRSLFLVAVDLLEEARLLDRLILLLASASGLGLLILACLQATHKAIDLTGGIDDPLLASIERVTVRAHVHAQALPGRLGRPHLAACAARDSRLEDFGMD